MEKRSEPITRFRIGTCGYSYPGAPPDGWYGLFYPLTAKKPFSELKFYSSYFDSVEINATFYRPATAAMAQSWADQTPGNFKFAVKVWQKFTHSAVLGSDGAGKRKGWGRFNASDVERFARGIAPLAESGKLGVLLFQYPASFRIDDDNRARLEATLAAFAGYRTAVELRHRSWSESSAVTQNLLSRFNSTWAFIDEPKFPSSVRQRLAARGDLAYIRLHGRNHQKWWKHRHPWERYDYLYQAENIRRLSERLKQLAASSEQTTFYVLFNNHARGQAAANALMLKAELDPRGERKAPKDLIDAYEELKDFIANATFGRELPIPVD